MPQNYTPQRTLAVFVSLMVGACSWVPETPDVEPPAVTPHPSATQSRVTLPEDGSPDPPAQAPQVKQANTASPVKTEPEADVTQPTECEGSPGRVIGLDAFYAATLQGDAGDRLYISTAPGAVAGSSYGLVGDEVEAIATALDATCTSWTWVKWPASDYRGWLPTASVAIQQ